MVNEDLELPVSTQNSHHQNSTTTNVNTDSSTGNNVQVHSPNPMLLTQEEMKELSHIDR